MNTINHMLFQALEALRPRSLKRLSANLSRLVSGRLWAKVLIGMALGVAAGLLLGPSAGLLEAQWAAIITNWLALPGQAFLLLVQMIVIPLIVASVARGIAANENAQQLRTTGLTVVIFFTITTAIGASIGMGLALVLHPGHTVPPELVRAAMNTTVVPPTSDVAHLNPGGLLANPGGILNLLPSNPLNAMVQSQMLQVVVMSAILGLALVSMPVTQARPLLELLGSVQEVCMVVVGWAMRLAPLAVFGLLAQIISKLGVNALMGVAYYVLTVLLGLLLMLLIYLLLVRIVARMSPLSFLGNVREVLLLAFSTSSSAAVMPMSIKTAEEQLKVSPAVAGFVIPLGATINMNGTALYQGVAAVFMAQVFGVDVGVSGLITIVVLAVAASIGSPGTPGVGIIVLAMILQSIGVPTAGIALILGVDRILDMSRTAINVCGDLLTCLLVDRLQGSKVNPLAAKDPGRSGQGRPAGEGW